MTPGTMPEWPGACARSSLRRLPGFKKPWQKQQEWLASMAPGTKLEHKQGRVCQEQLAAFIGG